MKLKWFVAICTIIPCVCLLFVLFLLHNEDFSRIPELRENENYFIHRDELVPRENIESFLIAEKKIFVLYNHASLVNVYNVDGLFLYGIQVPTAQNGRSDMIYQDGKLYIWTRQSDIYIFRGDELLDLLAPEDKTGQYVSCKCLFDLEKNHSSGTDIYLLSDDKSNIIHSSTMSPVLDLPKKSNAIENLVCFAMVFVAIAMSVYSKLFKS